MKLNRKTQYIHLFSFLKSMGNLFKPAPRKHKSLHVPSSKFTGANENTIRIFIDAQSATFPKHVQVKIKYTDDPIDALKYIKVNFALIEVDEAKITIDIVLDTPEQGMILNDNLNALCNASCDVVVEENGHVDY